MHAHSDAHAGPTWTDDEPFTDSVRDVLLARAESRGRQVLLYAPDGPLGGTFTCSRCAASAWQPDLLDQGTACRYRHCDPDDTVAHPHP